MGNPRPLFETCAVEPTGTRTTTGFRTRVSGCQLETWQESCYPPAPRGEALRLLRVQTATSLRATARLLELNVIEVSDLEMGRRVFENDSDWARATEIVQADARANGRLRWKETDPGFEYPPAACEGNEHCRSCPLFTCSKCEQEFPWCFGAADEYPTWCDACVDQHRALPS
jgi:hypothetical protein